jgi:hypothetical protein
MTPPVAPNTPVQHPVPGIWQRIEAALGEVVGVVEIVGATAEQSGLLHLSAKGTAIVATTLAGIGAVEQLGATTTTTTTTTQAAPVAVPVPTPPQFVPGLPVSPLNPSITITPIPTTGTPLNPGTITVTG